MPTKPSCPAEAVLSRRAFIQQGTLVLGAAAFGGALRPGLAALPPPALRFGLLTDVHYADLPSSKTRCYRESLEKTRTAVAGFNAAKADFAVELGDLIDAAPTVAGEIGHLKTIDAEYARFSGDRFYVLGNHCVWSLTKQQFMENTGMKQAHYAFDRAGFHFVVLDGCYRCDGVAYGAQNFQWTDTDLPAAEQDWLRADLRATTKPVIVFIHQRMDLVDQHAIQSGAAVRKLLEAHGGVLAVFQGHHHRNDHNEINGIHYCTLAALVDGSGADNNAYSMVSVCADGTLAVTGFCKHKAYNWAKAQPAPV
jgi:alkaline phosphatase